MITRLITSSKFMLIRQFTYFSKLTQFADQIKPVIQNAPKLQQIQIISTKQRQEFRQKNRIKNKRCGSCNDLKDDWTRNSYNRLFTQREAVSQATRCMKCADSPCQKACSTGIDIRSFIYQIQNQNYYGAAKTILSDNPLGLSCGGLCPVSELCASTCNAHWLQGGTIQIGKLQQFACTMFKQMKVKQIRDPSLKPLQQKLAKTKIALIGAGPASLSCATFLGRLGYQNVHIYQKSKKGGGLVYWQIPANRSNMIDLQWEISLVEDLGIKIHYQKQFGVNVTQESLKKEGFQVIFVGVGLNTAKKGMQKNAYLLPNVFTSKTFLPNICQNSKNDIKDKIYSLNGHVIVLGIGDTALDCARSALRVGAQRVTVVFRRGFDDLRANDQIFNPSIYQRINFISNLTPQKVNQKDGKCASITFKQYIKNKQNKYQLTDQTIKLDCDYVISAFGSQNDQTQISKMINKSSDINKLTMKHISKEGIYAGGDIIGTNNLVDAANDGKVASWQIHKDLCKKNNTKLDQKITLPGFFSQIDQVDISIEMGGIKFNNPFGLASAPPTTSYPMMRRAFEQGWGFAVVKTFVLDKDKITNVSPRIFKATNNPIKNQASFSNIQLVSEKKAKYWIEGAKQIKKSFPDKILVGSIMASYIQQDWKQLAKLCQQAPFDLVELNLSCNHGMPDKGMGRACSDDPDIVSNIVKWTKSFIKVPVYVKLSPNSTIAQNISEAVLKAGGEGVSCTNTMFSLMDAQGGKNVYPAVGQKKQIYFGGAAGAVIRPISLRVATNVSNAVKDINIMATGGIINAMHAYNYLKFGGCSVFQVCSAIQQQDFAITINDLVTGLKTLLYLQSRKDLLKKGWVGQSPPVDKVQNLKNYNNTFALWQKNQQPQKVVINNIPKLIDLKGKAQSNIQLITKMDSKAQKFPFVNNQLCVNCGKCYLTCLDSGYQAIQFDSKTHKPSITPQCTGCGLCVAVCPVPGAIFFDNRPKEYAYQPQRGDKYFK